MQNPACTVVDFLLCIGDVARLLLQRKFVRLPDLSCNVDLGDAIFHRAQNIFLLDAGTAVQHYRDLEAMLVGKTTEQAKAEKAALLKAYAERMVLTRGRVSAEYRKTVCMNLLSDFLTEKGI